MSLAVVDNYYEHYKSDELYKIVLIGKSVDTGNPDMVIYENVENGKVWVRPRWDFEIRVHDTPEGEAVHRFRPAHPLLVKRAKLEDRVSDLQGHYGISTHKDLETQLVEDEFTQEIALINQQLIAMRGRA